MTEGNPISALARYRFARLKRPELLHRHNLAEFRRGVALRDRERALHNLHEREIACVLVLDGLAWPAVASIQEALLHRRQKTSEANSSVGRMRYSRARFRSTSPE